MSDRTSSPYFVGVGYSLDGELNYYLYRQDETPDASGIPSFDAVTGIEQGMEEAEANALLFGAAHGLLDTLTRLVERAELDRTALCEARARLFNAGLNQIHEAPIVTIQDILDARAAIAEATGIEVAV